MCLILLLAAMGILRVTQNNLMTQSHGEPLLIILCPIPVSLSLLLFFKILFVYFWLCCVGFPLVAASRGCSSCGAQASHWGGFSCCRARGAGRVGSVVAAPPAAAPRSVGSSWTRAWTHVSCIGRWILYHWATREAPLQCSCLENPRDRRAWQAL